ncbi:MAG: hypothetical protein GY696_25940, partial [Gammaproteobacteria bacterium]|nr:hypothetical protein [Gammaproteobacteria bacterium]
HVVRKEDLNGVFSPKAVDEVFRMLDLLLLSWKCGYCQLSRSDLKMVLCDGCLVWYHDMCSGSGEKTEGWKCKKCVALV